MTETPTKPVEAKPKKRHVFDRPHFSPRQVCIFTITVIGICCSSVLSVHTAYVGIKTDLSDHNRRLIAIEEGMKEQNEDRGDQLNRIERMLTDRLGEHDGWQAGFKPIPKRAK